MSELASKNLLLGKILTILPTDFVLGKLSANSAKFKDTFRRELGLLTDQRSEYEARIDTLLVEYSNCFTSVGQSEPNHELIFM